MYVCKYHDLTYNTESELVSNVLLKNGWICPDEKCFFFFSFSFLFLSFLFFFFWGGGGGGGGGGGVVRSTANRPKQTEVIGCGVACLIISVTAIQYLLLITPVENEETSRRPR